eukprot:3733233-Lingulodinium_polyedra.AAC.1
MAGAAAARRPCSPGSRGWALRLGAVFLFGVLCVLVRLAAFVELYGEAGLLLGLSLAGALGGARLCGEAAFVQVLWTGCFLALAFVGVQFDALEAVG